MTRAAFQAAFADFKLIKGRKCAQIILEVPIEGADAALAALGGLPRPDQEAWVAVARIGPKAAQEDAQLPSQIAAAKAYAANDRRAWNDLPAVQQAGIRCGEKAFWRFLETAWLGAEIFDAEDAAQIVRERCCVASRSALLPGTPAEMRWQSLETAYQNWTANSRYAEVVR